MTKHTKRGRKEAGSQESFLWKMSHHKQLLVWQKLSQTTLQQTHYKVQTVLVINVNKVDLDLELNINFV